MIATHAGRVCEVVSLVRNKPKPGCERLERCLQSGYGALALERNRLQLMFDLLAHLPMLHVSGRHNGPRYAVACFENHPMGGSEDGKDDSCVRV